MHNPIQKISLLFYEGLASLRSIHCWAPLFYFWLLNLLGLVALVNFADLPGAGWVSAWLGSWFGEESLEYPRLYLRLPDIQRRLYLVLALTLGVFFRGVSFLHLVSHHTRGQVSRPRVWRRSLRLFPGHFIINLIGLLLFLLPLLGVRLWAPALGSGGAGRAIYIGSYAFGFMIQILLFYAPLLYLNFRSGIWEAMGESARFAMQHFWVTLGLVIIPFFFALPLQGIHMARRAIATQFRPELIFWFLVLTSLLTLFVLFIQISTMVRFYADEVLRRPFEGEWDEKPSHVS